VSSVAPDLVSKLTKYDPPGGDGPDVFAVHRIDEQLAKALDRKVWLPSGGTLVIDRTEAMTVVDVNTGKFTGAGGNLEQTVTKNNLEAAEEVVRQLRLRDIGGIVVIDFIDMVLESNRDLVLRRLTEALGRDRTRHQVSEVTSLGLVQLTRKKLGTGLIEAFSTTCTHCSGRGIVLHADPIDTAQAAGRRSEPGAGTGTGGGRRGKRGKRGRAEEAPVAKVPQHSSEHPMFKAMAAANGKHEDDEAEEELADEIEREAISDEDADTAEQVTDEVAAEDLDDDDDEDEDESPDDLDEDDEDLDEDESDDDEDDDEDEIDVDLDEDDEDLDEDNLDVDDDDEDDEDDDDEDEDDESESDEYDVDQAVVAPEPAATAGRHRRRAAARPAGPPAS
jgi:ribonuclease E